MSQAVNYRRWIYSKVERLLGATILEVGGGIGNFTEMYPQSSKVVTIEPHPECVEALRTKFDGSDRVEVVNADLLSFETTRRFDSVVCLNVLEHIEDDRAAIGRMAAMLAPGGRLLLIVPACKALYGPVDRALQHYRRYGRREVKGLILTHGLSLQRIEYMNLAGFFGWLINARLLKRAEQSPAQVAFYDRVIVPVMRRVESVIPLPVGQSLFVVAGLR